MYEWASANGQLCQVTPAVEVAASWGVELEIVRKGQNVLRASGPDRPNVGLLGAEDRPEALVTVNEFTFDEVALDLVPVFVAALFEK